MKSAASDRSGSARSRGRGGASLYGSAVEYAIHCLAYLIGREGPPVSSRDLAELQGVSPSLVAKLLPKLEKAGVVVAHGGIAGGYLLARQPQDITVLDIVDAVDGGKRVFDCKEIRRNCPLFDGNPPEWMTHGVCGVHAVMLRAENSMRKEMARTTFLDLAVGLAARAPAEFGDEIGTWLEEQRLGRERSRMAAVRGRAQLRPSEN